MQNFMEKILVDSNKIQTKIENSEMKLRGEHSNILITSFKGKNNTSNILLYNIRIGKSIDRLELTNSFSTSERELIKKLKNNNYKYIISFGQKPSINNVVIETFANKDGNKLKTNFPYKRLNKFLNERNIDNYISEDAGTYLCNNIYFKGLNYIKEKNLGTKMIFIHIPQKEQSYDFYKLNETLSDFIENL